MIYQTKNYHLFAIITRVDSGICCMLLTKILVKPLVITRLRPLFKLQISSPFLCPTLDQASCWFTLNQLVPYVSVKVIIAEISHIFCLHPLKNIKKIRDLVTSPIQRCSCDSVSLVISISVRFCMILKNLINSLKRKLKKL